MNKLLALLLLVGLASCGQNVTDPNKRMAVATPPSEEEDPPPPPPGGGEPQQWTVGLERRVYQEGYYPRVALIIKGPAVPSIAYVRVRLRFQSVLGRVKPWGVDLTQQNDRLWPCSQPYLDLNEVWNGGQMNTAIWASPHDTLQERDHFTVYGNAWPYNHVGCPRPFADRMQVMPRFLVQDYNPSAGWDHNGIVKVSIVPDMDSLTALPLMLDGNNNRLTLVPEPGKDTLTFVLNPVPGSWKRPQ